MRSDNWRFRFSPAKRLIKRTFYVLCIFIFALQAKGQTFTDLITRLNALPEASRPAVADSFMHSDHTWPFIEDDTTVHFIYYGSAQSVVFFGDETGWNRGKLLTHINGCDLWYYTAHYEADARLEYKFSVNRSELALDPLNKKSFKGGMGTNSEIRMPQYAVPPEISYRSSIPHGTIRDTIVHSDLLGNDRPVRIYLPPGYPSGDTAYPVILFHDGLEYVTLANADNILDYLTAKKMMSPIIAVFVPPVDRGAEFSGDKRDKYAQFIVRELMSAIDARYKTSKMPSKRAVAGISDGGNIALYMGMKYPGQFGKIAALSSNVQTVISKTFSSGPKLDLAVYLDIGSYDLPVLFPLVHNLRDILSKKGYNYQFHEWHDGHSWGNWRGHMRYPLMWFFPYGK